MEWTLAGLFGISIVLLVISLAKNFHMSKVNHREIDVVHISMMKEINTIQESIKDLELDLEVMAKETGVQLSSEEKVLLREVIDLYRRNYSIESIAEMKQVSVNEIEQLLAPYSKVKEERRLVANAN
nr:hypothetical protein [Neobacillus sp. Marseille-Q6967]